MYITLTNRKFHTVLASLERASATIWEGYPLDEDIASNGGEVVPLSLEELDDLIERINIEAGKQIRRVRQRKESR